MLKIKHRNLIFCLAVLLALVSVSLNAQVNNQAENQGVIERIQGSQIQVNGMRYYHKGGRVLTVTGASETFTIELEVGDTITFNLNDKSGPLGLPEMVNIEPLNRSDYHEKR